MTCYAVPLLTFFAHRLIGRKLPAWRTPAHQRLSLLLLGGATFGVVDHLWNGQLFLAGPGLAMDLLLGAAITAAIFVVWGVTLAAERWRAAAPAKE
jgi:hypothetical protein